MSLLQKAKVITTPTAYSDGILHSVKPEIALGPELVTNGDFSDGTNNWINNNSTLSVESGKLKVLSSSAFGSSQQNISVESGKTYKVSVDFTYGGTTQGRLNLYDGFATPIEVAKSEDGTISAQITMTSGQTDLRIRLVNQSATIGVYNFWDNVSVKEDISADFDFTRNSSATRVGEDGYIQDVQIIGSELVQNGNFEEIGSEEVTNGSFDTDSDWTLGTGWTIANGKLNANNLSGYALQNGVFASGVNKIYKISLSVSNYVSGYFTILTSGGTAQSQQFNADGDYTIYFKTNSPSGTTFHFTHFGSFIGSIDNVSVKEVGQDWTFNDWTIDNENGNQIAKFTGSSSGQYLSQSSVYTPNDKIRIQFTLSNFTSGQFRIISTGIVWSTPTISATNGTFTYDIDTTGVSNGNIYLQAVGGSFNGYVDNISVKEITDDTNLPRINYEGFTYDNGLPIYGSGKGHLLLEGQSTNLVAYSEDFTQWGTTGDITLESGYLAPDGTNTAFKVSTTNPSLSYVLLSAICNPTDTRSIYARSVSGTGTADLCTYYGNTDNTFTLTEQWQRFEVNGSTVAGVTNMYAVDFRGGGTLTELLIWGAQVEESSYATSYIPTNGSAVTRSAETCNNAGNADLFDDSEGVLYAEIAALADDGTFRNISLNNGTTAQAVRIYYRNTTNQITALIGSASGGSATINLANAYTFNKIAVAYQNDNAKVFVNGVLEATITGITMPTGLKQLDFDIANVLPFYGKTKMIAVFPYLSNDEMECLTSEGYGSFQAMALANNYTII